MAYGTRMDYRSLDEATAEAVKRTGEPEGHLGFLFRVDDATYAQSSGWDDDVYFSATYIELTAFPIRKRTPKGWRLFNGQWVGEQHIKRFAHPTVKEALESLVARRKRQAAIYEARASKAHDIIDRTNRMLEELNHVDA